MRVSRTPRPDGLVGDEPISSSPVERSPALAPSPRRVGAVLVLLGLSLTWLATTRVVAHQEDHHRAELDAIVLDAGGVLAARLRVIEQTLWTLGAEMKVDGTDIDEFTSIVSSGRLRERATGVHSLSFAREYPLPGPDRGPRGGESLVVERIVPTELEAGVVGALDLYVEDERRRATRAARDVGIATATQVRDLGYGGKGVLYYTPVYDADPRSIAQRRAAFLGVTIAVVDLDELFADVLGRSPLVTATVTDLGPANEVRSGGRGLVWTTGPVDGDGSDDPPSTLDLHVGDRTWLLEVRANELMDEPAAPAIVTAAAGVLLTAMLATLVVVILGARDRAERLAAARTGELREAYDRLVVADRLRRQFVTTVSHELRTPLTAVLGFVQTLRRLPVDPSTSDDLLARAERQTIQLRRMIEELLDFGRLERGELVVAPAPHDVRLLVREAVEDLRPMWDPLPVTVATHGHEPVVAIVDPAALGRVLANLLSNVVRYAPDSDEIVVAVAADADDVVISVADRGPGLAPIDAPHVFERFYRGGGHMGEGTGIGLAVVAGLAGAHGGSATLTNRPGGGAVATVRLPRAATEAVPPDEPPVVARTEDVARQL